MHLISSAFVLVQEGATAETGQVSPFVFGGFAFAALVGLLVVTMMIKVGD
jgi:hypothetical protein